MKIWGKSDSSICEPNASSKANESDLPLHQEESTSTEARADRWKTLLIGGRERPVQELQEQPVLAKIKATLRRGTQDPFYKNSAFLTVSQLLNVVVGFVFWILAARLYSVNDVGLAVALIAALNLILILSKLGLDTSLIRFFPSHDKSAVLNTCLMLTAACSLLVGLIYLAGVQLFSPGLAFVQTPQFALPFLFFCVMNAVAAITGYAFISLRKGGFYFVQTALQASRAFLLLPFLLLGSFGIFAAVGVAYTIAAIFAFLPLAAYVKFRPKIDVRFAKNAFKFSSGNYIANVLSVAPIQILPIVVLNLLGNSEAALVYIAFTITSVVLIGPIAINTALFVEGSHGSNLRKNVVRSAIGSYALLVPAIVLTYLFGSQILGVFGPAYVAAYPLLIWLVTAGLFQVVLLLFFSVQNVRMHVRSIVLTTVVEFVLVLGFSVALIPSFGSVGIGYASMFSGGLLSVLILIMARRQGLI